MIWPVNKINLLIGYTRVQGNFTQFFCRSPLRKKHRALFTHERKYSSEQICFSRTRVLHRVRGLNIISIEHVAFRTRGLREGLSVEDMLFTCAALTLSKINVHMQLIISWNARRGLRLVNKIKIYDNFLFNSLAIRSAFCPKHGQNFSWF